MRLQELVLPSFAQMLDALVGQLAKARRWAEEDGRAVDGLLSARLAPDMLPLASQIQFACTQAEEARARLLGEAPVTVEAPASFLEADALLRRTAERLGAAAASDRELDEGRAVEIALPTGMVFDLSLAESVRSWSLPQFYFHLVTAYAILRHAGVELGKADYVPHMLGFRRPGAT